MQRQNLLKNYSSLKNTTTNINCRINDEHKCQVINTSEVSQALNKYLEKVSTVVRDEKLMQICQEIEKIYDTTKIERNCGTTSNSKSVDGLFEKDIVQKHKNTNNSFSVENSTEVSQIPHKDVTNEVVTVDDFLVMQEEEHDSEKLQTRETAQNKFVRQQSTKKEHLTWLEKEDREKQEIQSLLVSNDKTVRRSGTSLERPYVCSKCQMAFKRNLHLKRHFIVTHTPNKNFKCHICGKLFSRKDYLDKHMSGHQKKNLKIKLLEQGIVVRTKIFSKSDK